MSYFCDHAIYIVVPTLSVTQEMWNNMKRDFNTDSNTARRSIDTPEKILFKVRTPVSSVFDGYEWLNHSEVLELMKTSAWQEDP